MNQPVYFATKTRLMGVVGLYGFYSYQGVTIADFFHIEFEEYGIDRFEQIIKPSEFQINQMVAELFGGLGGELVEMDEASIKQLLLAGFMVNKDSEETAKAFELSPLFKALGTFDKTLFQSAIEKVTEVMRSPYELMHYFIMRFVGQDDIYLRVTLHDKPYLSERFTLMRNHIERIEEDVYHFTALVLGETYHVLKGELHLDEGIISVFEIHHVLDVSDLEAALMLRKGEYVYVYDVEGEVVEQMLMLEHKYLAPELHANGRLLLAFRRTNDHVNRQVFELNADVEVQLFFTDTDQLVMASSDLSAMLKWNDLLEQRFGGDIYKYEEWEFDEAILYDFIDSGHADFEDYLEAQANR